MGFLNLWLRVNEVWVLVNGRAEEFFDEDFTVCFGGEKGFEKRDIFRGRGDSVLCHRLRMWCDGCDGLAFEK